MYSPKIWRSLAFAVAVILLIYVFPIMALATETEAESTDPTVEATEAPIDYSVSPLATIVAQTEEVISGVSVTFEHDDDIYYGATLSVTDSVATIAFNDDEGAGHEGTITVTNTTSEKITLTFYYEVTGDYRADKFTMNGEAATSPKTVTVNLEAHSDTSTADSVVFQIVSNSDVTTQPTMVLKDFTIGQAANKATVTHNGHGSVTVDGVSVASGSSVDTKENSVFSATAGEGAVFLGWIDPDTNTIRSTANPATFTFGQDVNVRAVFGHSTVPCFRVGTGYLFEGLQGAITKAQSVSTKTIISVNDATLTGSYTIPSGVTLLIPFNDSDTCYTTAPGYVEDIFTTPKAYRTLTMGEGASITVANGGAISVSAKVSTKMRYNGSPHESVGFIKMKKNSTITVQSGGNLYAWGYIVPNAANDAGSVTIQSGGKVYECYQITDWRGGKASLAMAADYSNFGSFTARFAKAAVKTLTGNPTDNPGVFPLNQYYVQNVEVPMTLEFGATEYGATLVNVAINGVTPVQLAFIGSNSDSNFTGMFRIASGSLTKSYDGTTDRLIIDVNGNLNIESMYANIAQVGVGGYTIDAVIDSTKYPIPVQSNMTVNIKNGGKMIVNQDLNMLPGSVFNIAEGGRMEFKNNHKLFLYDSTEWGDYSFNVSNGVKMNTLAYAPGRTYNRTEADLVDARIVVNGTLDASNGYVYSTASGAEIISTGTGTAILRTGGSVSHYQVTQSDTNITYQSITVTPAKLRHESGDLLNATAGTFYHDHYRCCNDTATDATVSKCGIWYASTHSVASSVPTAPTCTTQGYTTYTCTCGHVYKDDYVDALGHAWGEVSYTWSTDYATCTATRACSNATHPETETVNSQRTAYTAPTCVASGSATYTATFTNSVFAQQTKTVTLDATGHSWGDWSTGVCTNEGCGECAIKTSGIKLTITSEILLNLKFTIHKDLLAEVNKGTKLTVNVTEEENHISGYFDEDYDISQLKVEDGEHLIAQGIAAGEMTGNVTVTFKLGDVTVPVYDKYLETENKMVSTVTKTVQDFAKQVFAAVSVENFNPDDSTYDELKTMCEWALTFGGYAQTYFKTHEDKLAYNMLGDTAPTIPIPDGGWDQYKTTRVKGANGYSGPTATGQKLNLDSKIYMRIYFDNVASSGYAVKLTRPTNNGASKENIDLEWLTEEGTGRLYLDIEDVPPAYWNDNFVILIYKGSVDTPTESYTITTSPLAWCALCVKSGATQQQKNMAMAMYHYSTAADAYFTAKANAESAS